MSKGKRRQTAYRLVGRWLIQLILSWESWFSLIGFPHSNTYVFPRQPGLRKGEAKRNSLERPAAAKKAHYNVSHKYK